MSTTPIQHTPVYRDYPYAPSFGNAHAAPTAIAAEANIHEAPVAETETSAHSAPIESHGAAPAAKTKTSISWGRVTGSIFNPIKNLVKSVVNNPGKAALAFVVTTGAILLGGAALAAVGLAAAPIAGAVAIGSVIAAGSALFYGGKAAVKTAGAVTANMSGDKQLAEDRLVEAGEATGNLVLTAGFSKLAGGKALTGAAAKEAGVAAEVAGTADEAAKTAGFVAKSWGKVKNNALYKDSHSNMMKNVEESKSTVSIKNPDLAQKIGISEERIAAEQLKKAQSDYGKIESKVTTAEENGTRLLNKDYNKLSREAKKLNDAEEKAKALNVDFDPDARPIIPEIKQTTLHEVQTQAIKDAKAYHEAASKDGLLNAYHKKQAAKLGKELDEHTALSPETLRKEAETLRTDAKWFNVVKNHKAKNLEQQAEFFEKPPSVYATYFWDPAVRNPFLKAHNALKAGTPALLYANQSDSYSPEVGIHENPHETAYAVPHGEGGHAQNEIPGMMPAHGTSNPYEDQLLYQLAAVNPEYAHQYLQAQLLSAAPAAAH